MITIQDEYWIKEAYELAKIADIQGEVPVGAVLVDAQNQLLAKAYNQVIHRQDPTAHAEILVLREAARHLNSYRLNGVTLYVTLEPCAMCAGALVHARIQRLVFATRDFKAGACGSCYQLLNGEVLNHRVLIDEGVHRVECATLLSQFFQKRRMDY